jgi:hypothetical protein
MDQGEPSFWCEGTSIKHNGEEPSNGRGHQDTGPEGSKILCLKYFERGPQQTEKGIGKTGSEESTRKKYREEAAQVKGASGTFVKAPLVEARMYLSSPRKNL